MKTGEVSSCYTHHSSHFFFPQADEQQTEMSPIENLVFDLYFYICYVTWEDFLKI